MGKHVSVDSQRIPLTPISGLEVGDSSILRGRTEKVQQQHRLRPSWLPSASRTSNSRDSFSPITGQHTMLHKNRLDIISTTFMFQCHIYPLSLAFEF